MNTHQRIANIGAFFFGKARANQRDAGTYQAAKNLRKQGVPLPIALEVLAGRPPHGTAFAVSRDEIRAGLGFTDGRPYKPWQVYRAA